MAEPLHVVNLKTCLGDGICVEIRPEDILELVDERAATVETRADASSPATRSTGAGKASVGISPR